MSGVVRTKVADYLSTRNELWSRYLSLISLSEPALRDRLGHLHEFDLLSYSYHALQAYCELSKCKWDREHRHILDELAAINARVELRLPVYELCEAVPPLYVLRRELRESARKAARTSHVLISSLASLDTLTALTRELAETDEFLPEPLATAVARGRDLRALGGSVRTETHAAPNAKQTSCGSSEVAPVVISSEGTSSEVSPVARSDIGAVPLVSVQTLVTVQKQTVALTQAASTAPVPAQPVPAQPASTPKTAAVSVSPPERAPVAALFPASGKPHTELTEVVTSAEPTRAAGGLNRAVAAPTSAAVAPIIASAVVVSPAPTTPQYPPSSILDIPIQMRAFTFEPESHEKVLALPNTLVTGAPAITPATMQNGANTTAETDKPLLMHFKSKNAAPLENPRKRPPPAETQSPPKRPHEESAILRLNTWNVEHVKCLITACYKFPDTANEAVQHAFQKEFLVRLSVDEARALRLHYGLIPTRAERYKYHIQAFHLVAQHFFENRANYVVTPWAEIRVQFSRRTGINISDWEVKGRYNLYLFHRKIFGRLGEPSSNYHDLVSRFQRLVNPNHKSPLSYIRLTDQRVWQSREIEALIEAERQVPQSIKARLSVMAHYIKLKTGKMFDTAEIARRLKLSDVAQGVRGKVGQKDAAGPKSSSFGPDSFGPAPDSLRASGSANTIGSAGRPRPAPLPHKRHAPRNSDPKNADPRNSEPPRRAEPRSAPPFNEFDILFEYIRKSTKDDAYYRHKLPNSILTEFWNMEKSKSLLSTVEYISRIDPQCKDNTLRVARQNMIKIAMLRLLRDHQVKLQPSLVQSRLQRMMEVDVFDEQQCSLINEYLNR
ncbi:hypothetical protein METBISCDRAFT_13620 [Metschnikowia bicuspidata]|uniref:Uncharacterized protein n=1 Tax=Metschnikowia bicuspidata TaxID=27322 RepID=A0A4P9ZF17_9ASCO|nr:hypothetical protein METBISCDRAFT_13620 [Metschnikowia bicuspidata]